MGSNSQHPDDSERCQAASKVIDHLCPLQRALWSVVFPSDAADSAVIFWSDALLRFAN
jgi:hypothetical protein